MAGIFDTGIFDTGIFDHFAEAAQEQPPRGLIQPVGGWPFYRKKKEKEPEREELIEEVAEAVAEAVPQINEDESRLVALRLIEQMTWAQLRQIETLEAFIARVEAELAEMDDEEVLILAA